MVGCDTMEINNIKDQDKLLKILNRIETSEFIQDETDKEFVTFFFSFDIVNSTQFKTRYKGKWANPVSEILRHIISDFANSPSGGFQFWKTLGDEIIYTKNVASIEEIYLTLDEVYKNMQILNDKIDAGIICDKESGNILSIKATAWIAAISRDCMHTDNIYSEYQINDNRKQAEYMGPDIDAGFRVSYFTSKNRLVISFELAALLHSYNEITHKTGIKHDLEIEKMFSRVNLVTFKKLKGVWDDHLYPIFMFHGDDSVSFIDSLEYDSRYKEGIFKEYFDDLYDRERSLGNDFKRYEDKVIHSILNDGYHYEKLKIIIDIIRNNNSNTITQLNNLLKLHCTLLCFSERDDKFLFCIVKNKKTQVWDFGGFELYDNYNYLIHIKEYYLEHFGLEVSIMENPHYHKYTPLSISKYNHTCENGDLVKGAMYLAKIQTRTDILTSVDHDDMRMVSEDELSDYINNFDFDLIYRIKRMLAFFD